jgi:hypothetical protein
MKEMRGYLYLNMEALGGNWMARINSKKHKMNLRAIIRGDMDHHPMV